MLEFVVHNVLAVALGRWWELCLRRHTGSVHYVFLMNRKLGFELVMRLSHWKYHVLWIDHHTTWMSAICSSWSVIKDLFLFILVELTHHVEGRDLFLVSKKVLILLISTLILVDSRNLALPALLNAHDPWKRWGLAIVQLIVMQPPLWSIVHIGIIQRWISQSSYRRAVLDSIIQGSWNDIKVSDDPSFSTVFFVHVILWNRDVSSSKQNLRVHVMINCVDLSVELYIPLDIDVTLVLVIWDEGVLLRPLRWRACNGHPVDLALKRAHIFPDGNLVD